MLSSPDAHSTEESKLVKQKPVKRNLLEEDLSDDASSNTLKVSSVPVETKSANSSDEVKTDERSMKDIMQRVASSVPDIEKNLMDLMDEDTPVTTENVDKLIEEMEKLKVNSTQKSRKTRGANRVTVANYNKNVSRAVELLKGMAIDEVKDVNVNARAEKSMQNQKTSKEGDRKTTRSTTVETSRQNTDNASTSSVSKGKIKRCRSTRLLVNNVAKEKSRKGQGEPS